MPSRISRFGIVSIMEKENGIDRQIKLMNLKSLKSLKMHYENIMNNTDIFLKYWSDRTAESRKNLSKNMSEIIDDSFSETIIFVQQAIEKIDSEIQNRLLSSSIQTKNVEYRKIESE